MKTFDSNTIDHVDWMAGTVLSDFYAPLSDAGRERMERVERDSKDLNLLHLMYSIERDAGAPGIVDAYEIVRTDIARRVAADMKASHEAGDFSDLDKHHQFDPSIAFNPDLYAVPKEEREKPQVSAPRESIYDEAFSKPVISAETAHELGRIGAKLTGDADISGERDYVRAVGDVSLPVDRLERIERQKGLSTDTEAKASYDVVAVDWGTRLSVHIRDGIESGHLDANRLSDREKALVADPHAAQPAAAERAKGKPPIMGKGPDSDMPVMGTRNRGAER